MSLGKIIKKLIGGFLLTESQKLVSKVMEKYPELVTHTQGLITDARDPNTKGVLKLEKVALDIIPLFPLVIQAIPTVKTFAILFAQTVFADTLVELEKDAKNLISKI